MANRQDYNDEVKRNPEIEESKGMTSKDEKADTHDNSLMIPLKKQCKRKHLFAFATNATFTLICIILLATFPGEVDDDDETFRKTFYGTVAMFMGLQIVYTLFNLGMLYTGCFFDEKTERMCVKMIFHFFILLATLIAFPVVLVAYAKSPYNTNLSNPCSDVIENYFGDRAIESFCQTGCPCSLNASLYSSSELTTYNYSADGADTTGDCEDYAAKFTEYSQFVYQEGGSVDSSVADSSRPWLLSEWVQFAGKRERDLNCIWSCSYRPYYLWTDNTAETSKPEQTCFDALVEQFDEYYPYVFTFCVCLGIQVISSLYSMGHIWHYRIRLIKHERKDDR
eukprot:CAMPEP_0115033922 /NCGR_PEP_ID=MMETSP0216-20121206/40271_1 /TAXON_ID=223996 /ORGANISM="Protocruzia adherens, Strain Boccale" /LENGTH=337 /DNA_ID=CAMNT_0002412563 /DNA_START=40 /DNA_END=1050 /DNA_ORIENTATION=+